GWADTLQQYIVKPQPCSSARLATVSKNGLGSSWNAFPNPASDKLVLTFDTSWSSTITIQLYSFDGRCVVNQSIPSNKEIPLSQLPSGVYLLRVTDEKNADVKRIIIEH